MLNATNKKKMLSRLRRVEGQVGALRRMVEADDYCVDVLLQISAAQGALGKAGHLLLESHIRTCVADAMRSKDHDAHTDKVDELMEVFARYGRITAR